MTNQIDDIKEKIQALKNSSLKELETALETEYKIMFDSDQDLQKLIESHGNYEGTDYVLNCDGLYLWSRIDLEDYKDCITELTEYLSEYHSLILETDDDTIQSYCGPDFISIQDDSRGDNGIWQGHKMLFTESDYKTEENEICEDYRNYLIELHMEKTGYFPEVGRVSSWADFTLVSTRNQAVIDLVPVLEKFLNEMKHYQNYDIGFNGNPEDIDTEYLVMRVLNALDDSEMTDLKNMITSEPKEVMAFLVNHPNLDFNFTIEGE